MSNLNCPKVTILRLGHRPSRDKRLTTHLLLAARAFGASSAIYTGIHDISMEESIKKIVRDWGGNFTTRYSDNYREVIKEWEGEIVHLTMYGLPIQDTINQIRLNNNSKLIIVGGAKVPRDIYEFAHWNIAVTGQPHSEVSALAIFLNMLNEGKMLNYEFPEARLKITPQKRGKLVEHKASNS